jgi:hypothetical protein
MECGEMETVDSWNVVVVKGKTDKTAKTAL